MCQDFAGHEDEAGMIEVGGARTPRRLAIFAGRVRRWVAGRRQPNDEAGGLAKWQVARMIRLHDELMSLACEALAINRAGERPRAQAARIVLEVYAMAEMHQRERRRINRAGLDAWLRKQVLYKARKEAAKLPRQREEGTAGPEIV